MELNEKTLASELAFDGVLLKLYRDQVELSDGGTSIREVVHHPGGAAVVALDEAGNVWNGSSATPTARWWWKYPPESWSRGRSPPGPSAGS